MLYRYIYRYEAIILHKKIITVNLLFSVNKNNYILYPNLNDDIRGI